MPINGEIVNQPEQLRIEITDHNGNEVATIYESIVEHCCKSLSDFQLQQAHESVMKKYNRLQPFMIPPKVKEMIEEFEEVCIKRLGGKNIPKYFDNPCKDCILYACMDRNTTKGFCSDRKTKEDIKKLNNKT